MTSRKLRKSGSDSKANYHVTIAKDLVTQLDWEPGDKIEQDLVIGGSGAGQIKLEKIEESEEK